MTRDFESKGPLIVTTGPGSEYVLGSLARLLKRRGFEVIELRFPMPDDILKTLIERITSRRWLLMSSAHPFLDLSNSSDLDPLFSHQYPNYIGPVELIQNLRPEGSFWFPHDAIEPWGNRRVADLECASFFDYLITYDKNDPVQYLFDGDKVAPLGWVKSLDLDQDLCRGSFDVESESSPLKYSPGVIFPSEVNFLVSTLGPDGFVDYFSGLIKQGFKIKLPQTGGSEEKINAAFENLRPGCTISPSKSSTTVMQSAELVVCNCRSSIVAESISLGTPVIVLIDQNRWLLQDALFDLQESPYLRLCEWNAGDGLPIKKDLSPTKKPSSEMTDRFDLDGLINLIDLFGH